MEEQKEEVVEKKEEPSVEDMAAHDYEILVPKFKAKIEELSNRQLKNVVTALIEYPLASDKPQFSYPQEAELFYLGIQINDVKFVMMKAIMDMKKEDIQKLAAELNIDLEPKKEGEKKDG